MTSQLSYRILEDIARDLSGNEVTFPTFLDITFEVRTALNKPDLSIDSLARLVSSEPLMSTRIIRLANSVALNPSGRPIIDVNTAISRIGTQAVRTVSFAVAMEQLLKSRNMVPFAALSRRLWEHSMHVAALCRVLARRMTRVPPDEAMFVGLIHDLGAFYLLSRAVNFPELVADQVELYGLLVQWHDHIGHALLAAMALPEEILTVVQEHETERSVATIRTLADVLYVANRLASPEHGWRDPAFCETVDATGLAQLFDSAALDELLAESADDLASLHSALSG
ncbi:HDOD domain-containing protein [Accumulibacter sp.]|uniref:HDOD domain-containing protein n=1 Tax=Accumulibacter sp. TaxID=2053492 RepID=UPI0025DBAB14|nr:HDOD domain-containing protein [Accumulibacter sp.]MCM8595952.1 HDOD domain-containing protein [Accumulibacter sp.]MDS4050101.1 HDOD domain-containing protein [Accumulibacter sp.]